MQSASVKVGIASGKESLASQNCLIWQRFRGEVNTQRETLPILRLGFRPPGVKASTELRGSSRSESADLQEAQVLVNHIERFIRVDVTAMV